MMEVPGNPSSTTMPSHFWMGDAVKQQTNIFNFMPFPDESEKLRLEHEAQMLKKENAALLGQWELVYNQMHDEFLQAQQGWATRCNDWKETGSTSSGICGSHAS